VYVPLSRERSLSAFRGRDSALLDGLEERIWHLAVEVGGRFKVGRCLNRVGSACRSVDRRSRASAFAGGGRCSGFRRDRIEWRIGQIYRQGRRRAHNFGSQCVWSGCCRCILARKRQYRYRWRLDRWRLDGSDGGFERARRRGRRRAVGTDEPARQGAVRKRGFCWRSGQPGGCRLHVDVRLRLDDRRLLSGGILDCIGLQRSAARRRRICDWSLLHVCRQRGRRGLALRLAEGCCAPFQGKLKPVGRDRRGRRRDEARRRHGS
jgi:hypothetical protein